LFVAGGMKAIYEMLIEAKVPFLRPTAYFVAGVEFICGSLLASFATALSAASHELDLDRESIGISYRPISLEAF
jgi:hypothetical protein